MGVRFVLGRAGSGKTHHCLTAIRERLRVDAVDGPTLIFLVPEQAAQQMERALLVGAGDAGVFAAHRAEVLSFRRLAFRVLESAGASVGGALSDCARAMVLRHLLTENAPRLKYYRRTERMSGVVQRLAATLTELIQEGVTPAQIDAQARDAEGRFQKGSEPRAWARADARSADVGIGSIAGGQAAKLHDLALIHAAYLEYMGRGFVDPSQYLSIARGRFAQCEWLRGSQVWVDGFASLSGEEMKTLTALARVADATEVTALVDPDRLHEDDSLFGKTVRTYRELHDAFVLAGLAVDEPLTLRPQAPPRFARSASLTALEGNWGRAATKDGAAVAGGSDSPGTASLRARLGRENAQLGNEGSTDHVPRVPEGPRGPKPAARSLAEIEVVQLPSRRVEVEYAVSRVCEWVQARERAYRYRDVAIIARDLSPYHDLLAAALAARNIPFFMDRRRPTSHHPLIELVRAALQLAAQPWSLEAMRLLLKTGLLQIGPASADELENYLLAHGIAGREAWLGPDWAFRKSRGSRSTEDSSELEQAALARINATRRDIVSRLTSWWEFASTHGGHTGAQWAAGLRTLLETLRAGKAIRGWATAADADGRPEEADEHRCVWQDAASFLDDLEHALAKTNLGVAELADVVEAGLAGLTLGLAPPTIDQVLVGAIERSRHPDIKAAVLIGFNDGLFPARPAEESILNDDDRAWLRAAGLRVAAPARERTLDESLLAYIALTRPSERLVVTYATADHAGKVLRASPYLEQLLSACAGLGVRVVGDPLRERATWDIQARGDLCRRLALEFRSRPAREADHADVRARWNEVYDAARVDLASDAASRAALWALDERKPARLSATTVAKAFPQPLRTSVTQLEAFAACPFQFFARHVLRLREREQAALKPVDVGRVQHAVLETFVGRVSARRARLAEMSEVELRDTLVESCGQAAKGFPPDGTLGDARNAYLLRRSALHLSRVLRAQHRAAQDGQTRTVKAELPFGFDRPDSLPPLTIQTGKGRTALLRGYIDRVDLATLDRTLGIVIDYKLTPRKSLRLAEVYHGLSLQLLSYLLVLADHGGALAEGGVAPAAALFVSLASRYANVDHPEDLGARDKALAGTSQPRGLIRFDAMSALSPADQRGWLSHYCLYVKGDGGLGDVDKGDGAEAAAFERLLAHVRGKLAQLCDDILDGKIDVQPYRLGEATPCRWCEMRSVCGFESGSDPMRSLEAWSRTRIFEVLAGK